MGAEDPVKSVESTWFLYKGQLYLAPEDGCWHGEGRGLSVVRSSDFVRQTENLCFHVKALNLYMLLINAVFQKDSE